VENALELEELFNELFEDNDLYDYCAAAAGNYVRSKTGATNGVMAIHSGKTSSYQLIKMFYSRAFLIPTRPCFQFSLYPIFCFGKNAEYY